MEYWSIGAFERKAESLILVRFAQRAPGLFSALRSALSAVLLFSCSMVQWFLVLRQYSPKPWGIKGFVGADTNVAHCAPLVPPVAGGFAGVLAGGGTPGRHPLI